ncbi:hypothetical protein COT20_02060 [bacterium (Candidatus Gribaldobacteria) CG08_land_8_20_14_0_20_39_15]|uniref:Phosphomannomutase n=1 Tax=bacterium (Candidatus Gribaldobacteria) CG08_land_8_20_14_0_20_39_15 TaxID=2014273 RepID=A0A2M6XU82_9BACT|nr:MAG: hypothetical protein COT20_02060 [bacterium (Candidatus Gribaldobacteria) CG08_land_8_20_14_0_20_39_15]
MELFRAYDIRGQYPKDINDDIIYKIGRILVKTFNAKKIAVGQDVSLATPKIYQTLIKGIIDQGCDVIDLGIAGTDVVYFSTGHYGYDVGIEITASHSAGYLSGIKIIGPNASPFGMGFGMEKLKDDFLNYQETACDKKGGLVKKDVWDDFINNAISFVGGAGNIKSLKVVIDASNAVGALEIDHLQKHLPQIEFVKINWTLDGHYPGHQPNPFLRENRLQLEAKVKQEKADFGIAFDGDADRIYFVDERGDLIFGNYINGFIAEKMCQQHPGGIVIHDIRAMRFIKDRVLASAGMPKLELVGHAFFKNRMKKENALFGGEGTGHIYYNFGDYMVENSIIAFLQVLQIVSESGKSLRELAKEPRLKFPVIGEYNFALPGFTASDDLTPAALTAMEKILAVIREKYSDAEISDFDTLSVKYPDWNFNIRPSANDPLIRFSAEANDVRLLLQKQKEIYDLLIGAGCTFVNDTGVVQYQD